MSEHEDVMVIPEPKKGYKTTEFWFTLVINVLGAALVLLAQFQDEPWVKVAMTAIGALVSFLKSTFYLKARTQAKADVVKGFAERVALKLGLKKAA